MDLRDKEQRSPGKLHCPRSVAENWSSADKCDFPLRKYTPERVYRANPKVRKCVLAAVCILDAK